MLPKNEFPPLWLYSIGISVLPGQLSAVVLDKVYRVQKTLHLSLAPSVISDDGQKIDSSALAQIIEDTVKPALAEYLPHSVGYVTLMPPVCSTITIPKQMPPAEAFDSLTTQLLESNLFEDKNPFIQDARLWVGDSMMGVAACAIPKMLLRQYDNALSKLGIAIHKIEILPLSLARTMAASGVIDSMLMTHGQTMPWGVIATVGGQLMMMLWQGPHLMQLEQLPINAGQNGELLSQQMLTLAETSVSEYPAKWFVWPEALLKQDWGLKTPCTVLEIGPFYTQQPQTRLEHLLEVAPALGVGLCKQLLLPVEWDFAQYAQPAMLPMDAY